MVGLDVTAQALVYPADLAVIKDIGTPAAVAAHAVMDALDGAGWSAAGLLTRGGGGGGGRGAPPPPWTPPPTQKI
jgi:hypothetical protein